jgi:hypothetical protein
MKESKPTASSFSYHYQDGEAQPITCLVFSPGRYKVKPPSSWVVKATLGTHTVSTGGTEDSLRSNNVLSSL